MIYTGSKTLQHLTVAMFTVFKNLTIIVVALGEQKFFSSKITTFMWLSFALMVIGSLIGGFNDLSFSAKGYFWMFLNSASNASYLLYMKGTIKSVGFNDFDSVFYNNMLSLPILFGLSFIFEDWSGFFKLIL
jgi:GDP-mannose transporter